MALFDLNLAKLCTSSDDTNVAWGTHTAKRLPVSFDSAGGAITEFKTTYSGVYYAGLGIAASTMPTISGMAGSGGALRSQQPYFCILDTSSGVTAVPASLVQTATSNGSATVPYIVLDGRLPSPTNP
jgi:Tfp pilus assembly protein PilX